MIGMEETLAQIRTQELRLDAERVALEADVRKLQAQARCQDSVPLLRLIVSGPTTR
jgi:uncharacterized protein involved in type VI secretion and phage assembly